LLKSKTFAGQYSPTLQPQNQIEITQLTCIHYQLRLHRHFIDYAQSLPTDQQTEVTEANQSLVDDKVAKRVTFEEEDSSKAETIRNFYMMETAKEDVKPNFMLGEDEDVEEKDEFPTTMGNGGLQKQLSDAALMDKRRRLR
jgi:hypothetical protein